MTERMADEIKQRYPNSKIICYPDPAGKARGTNSTFSDHELLRLAKFTLRVKRQAPSVIDSVNAVNNAMKECIIDKRCKGFIRDLEQVTNKEGTRIIEKNNPELTHYSDAFRYSCDYEFPVRKPKTQTYLG